MRNVLDRLPDERRPLVRTALREAFRCDSAAEGSQLLRTLATKLQDEFPGAASSLREGLDDLFTVLDLGIRGRLRRFLQTTNAIENLFSSFRRFSRNVKRWRSGSMLLRWVGAAAIDAAKKFRRVKGHEDLRQLADALKPKAGKEAKRARSRRTTSLLHRGRSGWMIPAATRISTRRGTSPPERGRVLYFRGYDGPRVDNRTAWI
jgi:hypothetical protein